MMLAALCVSPHLRSPSVFSALLPLTEGDQGCPPSGGAKVQNHPEISFVTEWGAPHCRNHPRSMSAASQYVICHLACAPMRAAASHLSEKTHQLVFGETCQVLETGHIFWRARSLFEGYEGWIDSRQFRPISGPIPSASEGSVISDDIAAPATSKERTLWLPLGALLPDYHEGKFRLGAEVFHFQGDVHRVRPAQNAYELLTYALRYLHAPYYWGARTPWGIDCSGLVQMVFRAFGVTMLRDCSQQHLQGAAVESLAEAGAGDLAFFSSNRNPGSGIDHVGIISLPGKVIHASGSVRQDGLTDQGIIHSETGECSHTLSEMRRILPR